MVAIVWFRKDLRLTDHLALQAAVQTGFPILPLFILDSETPRSLGGASKWWLHYSLKSLIRKLKERGGVLLLKSGSAEKVLDEVIRKNNVTHVFWHRRYDEYSIKQDMAIKVFLKEREVICQSFNGSLLFEPHLIKTLSGTSFKVFTPFWRHCLGGLEPKRPVPIPSFINFYKAESGESLDSLALLQSCSSWTNGLAKFWSPGENAAQVLFKKFLDSKIISYKEDRDFPAIDGTSHLSPYLHWGEISVRQIWHAVRQFGVTTGCDQGATCFLSELGWREFSQHVLYHNPSLSTQPLREEFHKFPWKESEIQLSSWRKGLTGYPIVDAGMRELLSTGYMHNRVRMITASFLVKHLLQPWQKGEEWFWDTLVDADLANNSFNWQWVAGSGADAVPYFRIFNPILQSEKFDSKGVYIKKWLPELASLDNKYIHTPWLAPRKVSCYPEPIVNHQEARVRALKAFRLLKN